MRRIMACVLFVLLAAAAVMPAPVHSAAPAKYDPEDGYHQYIKWIGVARNAVRQRYPHASMIDLLYVGCKSEWPSDKQFVYKFWMQEGGVGGKQFGLYVTVDAAEHPSQARVSRMERADTLIAAYGKWASYAAGELMAKYPGAVIHSYKPFGCACLSKQASRQVFRFWIVQGGRNQLLVVTVDYDLRTGKALNFAIEPLRGV